MELVKRILTNILTALYQPFWPALVLTFFMSFFYLYSCEPLGVGRGYKIALRAWWRRVKQSQRFRKVLLFYFVTAMILFQTVLGRKLNTNPLDNVMGSWHVWKTAADGTVTLSTDCIENAIMMMPFTFLLLWTFGDKLNPPEHPAAIIWWATKVAFSFSFSIELLQLVLHLGSWQLSDITYNTLGGMIGGMVYCVVARPGKKQPDDEEYPAT